MAHRLNIGGDLALFGPVGFRGSDDDGFTVHDVTAALSEMAGDITVRINSGGGRALDGIAIFNALKQHDGEVTTVAQGAAASAASVIFMAGDERIMAHGALLMIHDAAGMTMGTEADHLGMARALGKLSDSLAAIYAQGTGRAVSVERAVMRAETWLNGADAVEAGFATSEINMGRAEPSAFDYRLYANAPGFLVKRARDTGDDFGRAVAAAMFAAPRQQPKEVDMTVIQRPRLVTTRDGWKAEYEQSTNLQAEFLDAENYADYMAAVARGAVRVATPPTVTPSKATTPDGWKAEYEASADLKAEFLSAESYAAYMKAEAKGLISFHRGTGRGV